MSGQVDSYAEKWDAERAVQRVSRAGAMATDAEADKPTSDDPGNAAMTRCADGVLKWMTALPMTSVKVVVARDSITLSGEVDRHPPEQTIDTGEVPLPTVALDERTDRLTTRIAVAPAAGPSDEADHGGNPGIRIVNNITVNC